MYIKNMTNSKNKGIRTESANPAQFPEKKWIITWNDYLGDLKYLFRSLHNYKSKIDQGLESNSNPSDWETPLFAQIRKKRPRESQYGERNLGTR
ncbi:MAG: hypothetical protein WCA39_06395 [Nitrososphaeraceae archaeon]